MELLWKVIFFTGLAALVMQETRAGPSPGSMSYRASQPRIYSPPTNCELTNECCEMASSDCCIGKEQQQQQKCYTVYKMKCDREDVPKCIFKQDNHCHDIKVRKCRQVTEIETKTFNATVCVEKPGQKCFDYDKIKCEKSSTSQTVTIDYKTQEVFVSANETNTHCLDNTLYNCEDRTYVENISKQVQKERKVTENKRHCKMVPIKSPDQQIVVPVTRVIYKTMCYNVPRSQCTQSACSGGTNVCPPDSSYCSTTNFNSGTVCPEPSIATDDSSAFVGSGMTSSSYYGSRMSGGCQSVRTPQCGNPSMCNSPTQQCCVTVNEQVCKQVPMRITDKSTQIIPGKMTWKEECDDYPYERTVFYTDTETVPVTKTKQDCQPYSNQTCHEYYTPTYEVTDIDKSQDVLLDIEECTLNTVTEEHCFDFIEYECKESVVTRKFKITKNICDVYENTNQCYTVPVTVCTLGQTANCKSVPEQVCQDTCSTSDLCKKCNNFVSGPGFGTCSTSTCENFISGGSPMGGGYWPGTIGDDGDIYSGFLPLGGQDSYFPTSPDGVSLVPNSETQNH